MAESCAIVRWTTSAYPSPTRGHAGCFPPRAALGNTAVNTSVRDSGFSYHGVFPPSTSAVAPEDPQVAPGPLSPLPRLRGGGPVLRLFSFAITLRLAPPPPNPSCRSRPYFLACVRLNVPPLIHWGDDRFFFFQKVRQASLAPVPLQWSRVLPPTLSLSDAVPESGAGEGSGGSRVSSGLGAFTKAQEFPSALQRRGFRGGFGESFLGREEAVNEKGLYRSCHPKSLVILKLVTGPSSSAWGAWGM